LDDSTENKPCKGGTTELFRPYRALVVLNHLNPGRRFALTWADLFWPFRPDGKIAQLQKLELRPPFRRWHLVFEKNGHWFAIMS